MKSLTAITGNLDDMDQTVLSAKECARLVNDLAALRLENKRLQEQLEAIGAGGVEPLRRRAHEEKLCKRCAPVCQGGEGCFAGMPQARQVRTVAFDVQPARQPLTDKQIQDIWCSARIDANQHGPFWFAHAIERAHGIGGEA